MRFDLFETMDAKEAARVLQEFLHRGPEILESIGIVPTETTLDTLADTLCHLARGMTTRSVTPDLSVPAFIRNTDDYKEGLFEFTEDSKRLVIAGAYLLGAAFIQAFDSLHWSSGNTDYATGNMPVVKGFSSGEELAPLVVVNNLFRRFVRNPNSLGILEKCVSSWAKSV